MNDKTRSVIELRKEGKLYEQIAEELGCTVKSVSRICENYGYTYKTIPKPPKPQKPKKTKIYDESILKLNQEGKGNKEIADFLGITTQKVRDISKRLGIYNNEKPRKIDIEVEQKIVKLRYDRMRYEEIAEQLGVNYHTVRSRIQRGIVMLREKFDKQFLYSIFL